MMLTMRGEENKPRRRTSTSVSPANGSLDLACESDQRQINNFHCDEPEPVKNPSNSSQQHWSALSTLLVLSSLLLFAFYVRVGQWKGGRSQIGDFLAGKIDDPEGMPSLGIVLHPERHRSRNASIITLHWTVTSDFRAPDGVKKRVLLINGEFPGPTIEARSGDLLIVHVENALESADDGISIHWHGLYMKGHNDMDGAVGFTQCAIPPGRNLTYEFGISDDQHGTFWYHAHSEAQRSDGLYGGLVIHKPDHDNVSEAKRYDYQREVLLMAGDWYHRSAEEMLAWYTREAVASNELVPDSLVINGHGAFNCSMAVPARTIECTKTKAGSLPSIFGYNLASTRLRLINTGSIAGLTVGISHAKMNPIQVDGGCEVVGFASDYLGILYPGERVDILVKWDSEVLSTGSELEIMMNLDNFNIPNPRLTPNQTFPIFPPFEAPSPAPIPPLTLPPPAMATAAPAPQYFNLQSAVAAPVEDAPIPAEVDQTILIYIKTQKLAANKKYPVGFMNSTSWSPQSPPLISLPRQNWDENQLIPYIPFSVPLDGTKEEDEEEEKGEEGERQDTKSRIINTTTIFSSSSPWVDIVINNLDHNTSHPFHLHGHSFYVLATHRSPADSGLDSSSSSSSSSSSYTASTASNAGMPVLNTEKPLRKDTVNIPRRGYVVLRFQAENRGVWMLECHAQGGFGSGMAMGIQVGGGRDAIRGWEVDEGARELCV